MRNLISFLKEAIPPFPAFSGRLRLKALQGDGSDRRIFRLVCGNRTFIAVSHPQGRQGRPSENDSFFYIARHLEKKALRVPRIFAFSPRGGYFLLEDFGELSLESHIRKNQDPDRIKGIYKQVLQLLMQFQIQGAEGFNPRYCYDTPLFDGLFSWDRESRYFLNAYILGVRGFRELPGGLESELKQIAMQVDAEKTKLFLYRDFQSRNIMVQGDQFGFIDFQGGRLGPPQYDLASLLIDPYVQLSWEMEEELVEWYLKEISQIFPVPEKQFRDIYQVVAFQRNLQILGAFSFLSRVKGKTYFEAFIPGAIQRLKKRVAGKHFRPFKEVRRLVGKL